MASPSRSHSAPVLRVSPKKGRPPEPFRVRVLSMFVSETGTADKLLVITSAQIIKQCAVEPAVVVPDKLTNTLTANAKTSWFKSAGINRYCLTEIGAEAIENGDHLSPPTTGAELNALLAVTFGKFFDRDDRVAEEKTFDYASGVALFNAFRAARVSFSSGCWISPSTTVYQTVAEKVFGRPSTAHIRHLDMENGDEALLNVESAEWKSALVRHHVKCELLMLAGHKHCCRISHLTWGTTASNDKDKRAWDHAYRNLLRNEAFLNAAQTAHEFAMAELRKCSKELHDVTARNSKVSKDTSATMAADYQTSDEFLTDKEQKGNNETHSAVRSESKVSEDATADYQGDVGSVNDESRPISPVDEVEDEDNDEFLMSDLSEETMGLILRDEVGTDRPAN